MKSWDLGPWWMFECGSGLNRVSFSRSREWLERVAKFLHYLMRNDKRQGSSSLYRVWSEDGSERLQKVIKYELSWPLLFTGSHRERLDNFGRFSVWRTETCKMLTFRDLLAGVCENVNPAASATQGTKTQFTTLHNCIHQGLFFYIVQ
jgi:hypothetical protein